MTCYSHNTKHILVKYLVTYGMLTRKLVADVRHPSYLLEVSFTNYLFFVAVVAVFFVHHLIRYLWYAMNNIVRGSYNLSDVASIEIDGQPVVIPDGVKTVVVLNFVCYQAGVDIWGPDENVWK